MAQGPFSMCCGSQETHATGVCFAAQSSQCFKGVHTCSPTPDATHTVRCTTLYFWRPKHCTAGVSSCHIALAALPTDDVCAQTCQALLSSCGVQGTCKTLHPRGSTSFAKSPVMSACAGGGLLSTAEAAHGLKCEHVASQLHLFSTVGNPDAVMAQACKQLNVSSKYVLHARYRRALVSQDVRLLLLVVVTTRVPRTVHCRAFNSRVDTDH